MSPCWQVFHLPQLARYDELPLTNVPLFAEEQFRACLLAFFGLPAAVQVVSRLLEDGPQRLLTILQGLKHWMEEHDYESLEQMRGSMSLHKSPDPGAFERGNYMRVLSSWSVKA